MMGDLAGEPFPRDWFEEPSEPVSPARVYSAWVGGKDAYPADRALAEAVEAIAPEVPRAARANRRFQARVVHRLVQEGLDQILDLGAGMPVTPNVHEIAQAIRPDARVVYVDRDPIVITHARALQGRAPGVTIIDGDLRDATAVMTHPLTREAFDLERPIVVLMLAVLHFLTDTDDPAGLVKTYADHLPAGSVVVISHATSLTGIAPWTTPAPPAPAPRVTWPIANFFRHHAERNDPTREAPADASRSAPTDTTSTAEASTTETATEAVPGMPAPPAAAREDQVLDAAHLYSRHATPITLRTAGEIRGLLGGLALDPEGVIPADLWYPEPPETDAGETDPTAAPDAGEPDDDSSDIARSDAEAGIAPVLIALARTTP